MRKFSLSMALLPLVLAGCGHLPGKDVAHSEANTAAVPKDLPAEPELPRVDLTPDILYKILLADVASQRGELAVASQGYYAVAAETRDPRFAKKATEAAIYARDLGQALRAVRLWVELVPNELDARRSAAALLIRAGEEEEALTHLKSVLTLASQQGERGYAIVGDLLSREQDKHAALELMQQLQAGNPDDPEALYALAHIANLAGQPQMALATLDRLLTLNPRMTQALVLRANVQSELGEQEAGLSSLKRAIQQSPDDLNLRLTYARLLVDARRLEQARAQFRELVRLDANNGDAHYALGLLALQAGDLEDGEKQFLRLLQLRQRTNEAAFSLGQIAETREDFDNAVRWYSSVAEDGPNYIDARIRIAAIIAQRQDVDAARGYLYQLDLSSPEDQMRRFLAEGELLLEFKRFDDAFDVYNEALTAFPGNIDLLYARAMVAERIDRLDLLEQDLKAILQQEPDNAQALNALGYTLADRTDRLDEAYDYVHRALAQIPDDPGVIDSMGWVLYRQGRYEESLSHLRRALKEHQDGEIAAHLGEVLWVMGRKKEARQVWDSALEYAPDHEALRRVMERFSQ